MAASGEAQFSTYVCPFPLTGPVVEHQGHLYHTATKCDCFQFRQVCDELDGFTLRYDKNGVLVWDKKIPGEAMAMIKVFAAFPNIAPATMNDMLHDGVYRCIWDTSRIDAYRITLLNNNNDIGYYAAKVPTPVTNRDFINQRAWHNAGNGEYIIFNTTVIHNSLPPQKGFVRAMSRLSGYLIQPLGQGCSITYLTQSDPKGWIPTYFVNYITTKLAPSVMDKLAKASQNFEAWREEQMTHGKWLKDWQQDPIAWDDKVENKTQTYALKHFGSGVASPVVPATPVEEDGSELPQSTLQSSPPKKPKLQLRSESSAHTPLL